MPDFLGVSHVDLTVRDVPASAEWYSTVFGLVTLMETDEPDRTSRVLLHPGSKLAISLGTHPTNDGSAFDETRTGLDHLSFRVRDRAELEAWVARFDELGVHHSGITDAPYGSVVVFRDPDNIQLELFVGA